MGTTTPALRGHPSREGNVGGLREDYMQNILRGLKTYLGGGFGEIFLDFLPDAPDCCAALYIRDSSPCPNGDGSRGLTLEAHVRGLEPGEALGRAEAMMAALDSGYDEEPVPVDGAAWAVIRPSRGPRKLKEDGFGRLVYGFECAVGTRGDL